MKELPENKFGYLCLLDSGDKTGVYIKANKITTIIYADNGKVCIYDSNDTGIVVEETIDEILEQLENIHPSMR